MSDGGQEMLLVEVDVVEPRPEFPDTFSRSVAVELPEDPALRGVQRFARGWKCVDERFRFVDREPPNHGLNKGATITLCVNDYRNAAVHTTSSRTDALGPWSRPAAPAATNGQWKLTATDTKPNGTVMVYAKCSGFVCCDATEPTTKVLSANDWHRQLTACQRCTTAAREAARFEQEQRDKDAVAYDPAHPRNRVQEADSHQRRDQPWMSRARELRRFERANGICPWCHKKCDVEGRVHCSICAAKHRALQVKNRMKSRLETQLEFNIIIPKVLVDANKVRANRVLNAFRAAAIRSMFEKHGQAVTVSWATKEYRVSETSVRDVIAHRTWKVAAPKLGETG